MNRRMLLEHLRRHGCEFVREGGEHSIWQSAGGARRASVPRHSEIPKHTAARICKQLQIPPP